MFSFEKSSHFDTLTLFMGHMLVCLFTELFSSGNSVLIMNVNKDFHDCHFQKSSLFLILSSLNKAFLTASTQHKLLFLKLMVFFVCHEEKVLSYELGLFHFLSITKIKRRAFQ